MTESSYALRYMELRTKQDDIDTHISSFEANLTTLATIKTQALSRTLSYKKKAVETGMTEYDTISNEFWRLNQRIGIFLKNATPRMQKTKTMSSQVEEYFKHLKHNSDHFFRNVKRGLGDRLLILHARRSHILFNVMRLLKSLDGFLGFLPATCGNLLQRYRKLSLTSQERVDRMVFLRSLPRVNGNCPICLDDSVVQGLVQLPCHVEHVFHLECLERWLENSKTCPLDRRVVFASQAGNNARVGAGTVPYGVLHGRPHVGEQ